MSRRSVIFSTVFLTVLAVSLSSLGFQQTGHGVVRGWVSDESGNAVVGAVVTIKGTKLQTNTDVLGEFRFGAVPAGSFRLSVTNAGYQPTESPKTVVKANDSVTVNLVLGVTPDDAALANEEKMDRALSPKAGKGVLGVASGSSNMAIKSLSGIGAIGYAEISESGAPHFNTESYDPIDENTYRDPKVHPLSTFSIDVDAASYSNVRRFIQNGQLPPQDAVRIEEMINYFTYHYEGPRNEHPFAIHTELTDCPWQPEHKLLLVGLQGKKIATENLPPSNLVFLLDVSGSMDEPNKLPLVKAAFRLLVDQLRPQDRVAIVVYAGSAGLVLPSTAGSEKQKILAALDALEAGGSTAGGAGIQLAYRVAAENFLKQGNNRVILATDGDFNVGVSSDGKLVRLIEEKRNFGVYLSVLGFGTGNYKDSKMEKLADKGNGNFAYVDNLLEAKKVFVGQMAGTLYTIAKDVKIQIEFNPAIVQGYRLVGYENRMLQAEDFNNDRKDAGELGSGHTVTALYEIVPPGAKTEVPGVDPLKYQSTTKVLPNAELATVKFRYKPPTDSTSRLMTEIIPNRAVALANASENVRFASSVAEFGLLLRDSKFKGQASALQILKRAREAKGVDQEGYRAEFIRLVEMSQLLSRNN